MLNDADSIAIPRNSKEMYLNNYDTIIKRKGTNGYIVKRPTLWIGEKSKQIDTFAFECTER